MKLEQNIEEIKKASEIMDAVYDRATEITARYFEVVLEDIPRSTPYVDSIDFHEDTFTAYNNLDHNYDYKGTEYRTIFIFPTEWLFADDLEELLKKRKQELQAQKKEQEKIQQQETQDKIKRSELAQLEELKRKYPNN